MILFKTITLPPQYCALNYVFAAKILSSNSNSGDSSRLIIPHITSNSDACNMPKKQHADLLLFLAKTPPVIGKSS